MTILSQIIQNRRSIRRFLKTPISHESIKNILDIARHAPSGSNTQPWNIHVVQGKTLENLIEKVQQDYDAVVSGEKELDKPPYDYYPTTWFSPYLERRKATGLGLYGTLGIGKTQKAEMVAQQRRNYQFFDAPCALICTLDNRLGTGSYLDCGLFLQNIVLLAEEQGLSTCLQASFLPHQKIISDILNFQENEQLLCAIAIGFADRNPEILDNQFQPEKKQIDDFVVWHE